MPDGAVTRFFGGSPLRVVVRLAVLSLVVGIVLAALGLDPILLWQRVWDAAEGLVRLVREMGLDVFGSLGRWLVTGALIVVPIWFLTRLAAFRRER